MSQTIDVDGMTLTMPTGWSVWKYDDSAFHRNQFQSFAGGSKAVDVVALGVALCEPHLAWGDSRWDEEITRYQALIKANYALPAM